MSNQSNTNIYEIARDHYDFWSEAGNDLWCGKLEGALSGDMESLNEVIKESASAMYELEMQESYGMGECDYDS